MPGCLECRIVGTAVNIVLLGMHGYSGRFLMCAAVLRLASAHCHSQRLSEQPVAAADCTKDC